MANTLSPPYIPPRTASRYHAARAAHAAHIGHTAHITSGSASVGKPVPPFTSPSECVRSSSLPGAGAATHTQTQLHHQQGAHRDTEVHGSSSSTAQLIPPDARKPYIQHNQLDRDRAVYDEKQGSANMDISASASAGPSAGASGSASRASDLARKRLAAKRERERQKAEALAAAQEAELGLEHDVGQGNSMTSEEPPVITPSATDASFSSTYSSFDASAHGHSQARSQGQYGLGHARTPSGGILNMAEADAAQHLAYIQEKDPFASFNPSQPPASTVPPPSSFPSTSTIAPTFANLSLAHGQMPAGVAQSVSLSRHNSARPSIDTTASIMNRSISGTSSFLSGPSGAGGVRALRRREMLRPDHSVGIEEEQEWGEEEETMDKVGEVQLPPMPSYFSSSRLDLHPSASRTSSSAPSLMQKTRRWDPHAKRMEAEEKPDDAPATFGVVKPDGWNSKMIGLDATYKREKKREDRRQLVGKVFGFGRKKGKGEVRKERWEDEIEGRSVSMGSGSNRDSGFVDLGPSDSKLSLTSSSNSRSMAVPTKGILKTRPPPLPLNEVGHVSSTQLNVTSLGAAMDPLSTPTVRTQVVPPSASTITSQSSLRPTPRSYASPVMPGTAGTVTPGTSVFAGSSEDVHKSSHQYGAGSEIMQEDTPSAMPGQKVDTKDSKAYKAHRQSLPWGKAILSGIGASKSDESKEEPVPPAPDFSRPAASTPDSYKYSPTAEALARYASSIASDDAASIHRQYLAYGSGGNTGGNSVDSTPGQEMATERLFYKVPKPSSTALGSVVNTPGLGVVDEYPVPHMPALPTSIQDNVPVGTAVTIDRAVSPSGQPSPGKTAVALSSAASMSMSRSASASHSGAGHLSPSAGVGMSVQASSSSSALPYLSPVLGSSTLGAEADRADPARSRSPTKRTIVRSNSITSDRPSAIYESDSAAKSSATAEGLMSVAIEAGESIWDPKVYMLSAPSVPTSGLTYAEKRKRHWDAYDHALLRAWREKDKLATLDELACGRTSWRDWLWPVPPNRPEKEKDGWKRKNRTRTRRIARARRSKRIAEKRRQEEEEEEEEELVQPGFGAKRDWSKVRIDGYRPAPPPPSASGLHRSGSMSSTVDSPLTPHTQDLADSASRLEASLQRSGSGSQNYSAGSPIRRESRDTTASAASKGSISSEISDFTVRSTGSGGTASTARRMPPPTPPPVGPLPRTPFGAGSQVTGGSPARPGSSAGNYSNANITSSSGQRVRAGSFGMGAALRAPRVQGATATGASGGGGTPPVAVSLEQEVETAEAESKLTPAERRRRMRGKVAVMDLAGEIKKIDQDREAELAAAEEPIDEDRPRVIRFAGVQILGEP